ncbi:MAG: hypothetical protein Fur0010_19710 [Bdellovibrio sp.]
MRQSSSNLSLIVENLVISLRKHDLTIGELFKELGDRSHAIIIMIFSLPFLTPIPLPGVSVFFGIIVMISSVAMIFDTPIRLPKKIERSVISSPKVADALQFLIKYIWKFEKLIHKRGIVFVENRLAKIIYCVIIFISAFILSLPLPPGTNFPPALSCLLLSLGMLERDFFIILLGLIWFCVMIFLFSSMSKLIFSYLEKLIHYF